MKTLFLDSFSFDNVVSGNIVVNAKNTCSPTKFSHTKYSSSLLQDNHADLFYAYFIYKNQIA